MNTAVQRVNDILTSAYSTKNFTDLIREIFPTVKIVAPDSFHKEFTNFSSHIEGSSHVGNYTDPEENSVIIYSVQLKKESYVETSRSTQRNYAKKLMEAGNADAAIIAFYTEDDPKWRISFVRLDYELKFENGRMSTEENLTPARRYSYLVGKDEPCHTAITRFHRFITDESNTALPTVDDLEEAFSVEKVTNEFFDLYKDKYLQVKEWLESNEDFINEAEVHNYTSSQFTKKLMGQIVFLYFLQKKGWLGVNPWKASLTKKQYDNLYYTKGAKGKLIKEYLPQVYVEDGDDNYRIRTEMLGNIPCDAEEAIANNLPKQNNWGDGSKTFMRTLFEFAKRKGANFFDDYLEPLFYNALNVNRGDHGYDPILHCRIPFLSGGLFEPIDGYDWEHNDFAVPNELFSNKDEKGDRDADGILDIFDRYNFTMSEDEPLEREVAIDPEMLGKVFENLLEVNDRKSKGAFYTPREIVHYMCQETLISYLVKETGIPESDIRDFVLLGDYIRDSDTEKTLAIDNITGQRRSEDDLYRPGYHKEFDKTRKLKIPESILCYSNGVNRLRDIDDALAGIRIADPAVGSGAFPLGMLNEIVRARQNISAYMSIEMSDYESHMMYNNERSPYSLKRQTIKDCIFASDIEPSAVDITQLRLWLSLVIDDEINPNAQSPLDGHKNPIPLPNLECNIVCGNSLIDEFEGIALLNNSDVLNTNENNQQRNIFQNTFETILPLLLNAQDELFRCQDPIKKQEWKDIIDGLKLELAKVQMDGVASYDQWERYHSAMKQASHPFVLWQIDFARVFREKGGFDAVIGNPPYVGEKGHKDIFQKISTTSFGQRFYLGKVDLFYFFFHKAIDLLKDGGICTLITTNYYITALGARKLRADFKSRASIFKLINFNELKLFPSALGQHNMITMLKKGSDDSIVKTAITSRSGHANKQILDSILNWNDTETEYYSFKQSMLYEGDENYIRISGVGNLCNPLESIFTKMKSASYRLGEVCAVNIGMRTGADKLSESYIKKYGIDLPKNTGIYVLTTEEIEKTMFSDYERSFLVPWFKNSDIGKYHCKTNNDLWLLDLSVPKNEGIDFSKIPNIYKHIVQFKAVLENRKSNDNGLQAVIRKGLWWAFTMRQIDFSAPKIVSPQRSKKNTFAYNEIPWYASMDVYFITSLPDNKIDLKYVLALLNSKLYYVWFFNKGKRKGDTLELYQKPLSEVPIIIGENGTVDRVCALVDSILSSDSEKMTEESSAEIDEIVFDLYKLSEEERQIVRKTCI